MYADGVRLTMMLLIFARSTFDQLPSFAFFFTSSVSFVFLFDEVSTFKSNLCLIVIKHAPFTSKQFSAHEIKPAQEASHRTQLIMCDCFQFSFNLAHSTSTICTKVKLFHVPSYSLRLLVQCT